MISIPTHQHCSTYTSPVGGGNESAMRTSRCRYTRPIEHGNIFRKTILITRNKGFWRGWVDSTSDPELHIYKTSEHGLRVLLVYFSAHYVLYFSFFFKVPFQNKPLWSPFCKAPIFGDLAKTEAKFCVFTQTKHCCVNVEVVNKQTNKHGPTSCLALDMWLQCWYYWLMWDESGRVRKVGSRLKSISNTNLCARV